MSPLPGPGKAEPSGLVPPQKNLSFQGRGGTPDGGPPSSGRDVINPSQFWRVWLLASAGAGQGEPRGAAGARSPRRLHGHMGGRGPGGAGDTAGGGRGLGSRWSRGAAGTGGDRGSPPGRVLGLGGPRCPKRRFGDTGTAVSPGDPRTRGERLHRPHRPPAPLGPVFGGGAGRAGPAHACVPPQCTPLPAAQRRFLSRSSLGTGSLSFGIIHLLQVFC